MLDTASKIVALIVATIGAATTYLTYSSRATVGENRRIMIVYSNLLRLHTKKIHP